SWKLWLRRLLLVSAALLSWAVVVGACVSLRLGFLFVGLFRAGAQSGLARSIVDGFTREHHVAEAPLHGIKFRRRDNVFRTRRKNSSDFFLRVFNSLRRRRMRGKRFSDGSWP